MAGEILSRNPGQDNNPSAERGGRRFGVSAPPTERATTPTREAPHPPTKEEITPAVKNRLGEIFSKVNIAPPPTENQIYDANSLQPAWDKELAEKVGGKWPRRIAVASGVGALAVGGYVAKEIYQNTAIHERVESFSNTFTDTRLIHDTEPTKVNPDEIFDNGTKKTEVSKKNIQFIDSQQEDQFSLKIDKEGQTIIFPFPFKIAENTVGTIERIDLADTDPNAQDPTQRPPIAPVDFRFNEVVTIVAPEDSHMYLIKGIQEWGQDPNLAGQVRFYKYYEEQDTTVVWWIFDNNPTRLGNFNNLLPMQDFEKEKLRGVDYKNLPVVNALTEVMTTTDPNQLVRLDVIAYKGKIVGPEAEIAGDDFLLKPQFPTVNYNGSEKLLALKK